MARIEPAEATVTVIPTGQGSDRVLARNIVVDRRNGKHSITIDGQEFPWHIAEDSIETHSGLDDVARVTVTILAENLRVRA
ncbi:hypothetical protein [Plantibacter sp. YIM 135249]|uniref:hypothetical protein n=1 Tax=Plantibacter sp. YIM 135249 TaxID=3423918 RepID=UPI003D3497CC